MNDTLDIRAYVVEGTEDHHPGVIVFARDEIHAIFMAARDPAMKTLRSDQLSFEPLPQLNAAAAGGSERVLSWFAPADAAIYRDMGWEVPGQPHCRQCLRVELPQVPGSTLDPRGLCVGCVSAAQDPAAATCTPLEQRVCDSCVNGNCGSKLQAS